MKRRKAKANSHEIICRKMLDDMMDALGMFCLAPHEEQPGRYNSTGAYRFFMDDMWHELYPFNENGFDNCSFSTAERTLAAMFKVIVGFAYHKVKDWLLVNHVLTHPIIANPFIGCSSIEEGLIKRDLTGKCDNKL